VRRPPGDARRFSNASNSSGKELRSPKPTGRRGPLQGALPFRFVPGPSVAAPGHPRKAAVDWKAFLRRHPSKCAGAQNPTGTGIRPGRPARRRPDPGRTSRALNTARRRPRPWRWPEAQW
jgi:hypothetical protein